MDFQKWGAALNAWMTHDAPAAPTATVTPPAFVPPPVFPPNSPAASPAPVAISSAIKENDMSILTKDIRAAGFGGVLDDVEAAEKAVSALLAPGGLTPENVAAAAAAAAKATSSASTAVVTVEQNPVAEGSVLVVDALNFLAPIIQSSLTKKAGTAGTVNIDDLSELVTGIQAFIGKL